MQRKLAATAHGPARHGAPPMPETGPVASEYQLLLAALGIDLSQLRDIQSIERKIEAKRGMIARYADWLAGALASEEPAQDEIVSTMMVWAIDIADWDLAIRLAEHVLQYGIALPERYRRPPATLIAEEVAEAALSVGRPVPYDVLARVESITAEHDMHDQVRAKLAKALGLSLMARADAFDPEADSALAGGRPALVEAALHQLRRALQLDAKVGVKKSIEGLERELKKLAAPEGA